MRIAVTTTSAGSSRHAAILTEVGLTPVVLPCIRVEPAADAVIEEAQNAAAVSDLIVLTSVRTVTAMWPDGDMPGVPVAAVGQSTAAAVIAAGGRCRYVGSGGAEALLAGIGDLSGLSVAYPHAAGADPAIGVELSSGADVVAASAVYATIPVAPDDDPVDGVMFSSPSAVTGWMMGRSLDRTLVAAIGPTTAAAVRQRSGRSVDIVPSIPDLLEMAQLIAIHQRDRTTV